MTSLFRLLLFIIIGLPLMGQTYLPIEHITPKDGLSYRFVRTVFKDSIGFIWVGTRKGLNRYTGVDWKKYQLGENSEGVYSFQNVNWIFDAEDQNVMVGTAEKGNPQINPSKAYLLNSETQESKELSVLSGIDTLALMIVLEPFKNATGEILTCGITDGKQRHSVLLRYLSNGLFEQIAILKGEDIHGDLQLWGVANDCAWYWNGLRYYQLRLSNYTLKVHLVNDISIEALSKSDRPVDQNGRFWFPARLPTDEHLFQSFVLPESIRKSNWSSFTFDNYQNVWIKSQDDRLYKYDFQKRHISEQGEFDFDRDNLAGKIFIDKENTVWIPHRFGISKIRQQRTYFENYMTDPAKKEGLSIGKEAYALVEDFRGRIIITGGLFYELDPLTGQISQSRFFSESKPEKEMPYPGTSLFDLKMITAKSQTIWMNRPHAPIYQCDMESGKYRIFTEIGVGNNSYMQEDLDGRLWRIINGYLSFYNPQNNELYMDTLRSYPRLRKNLLLVENELWADTKMGLVKFNIQNDSLEYFELYSNIKQSPSEIISMISHNGYIWLGTTLGLLRFNPGNRQLITYNEDQGLPHSIIYTILTDGNYLWLGTHEGLCKFNINTETIKNYYVEDGLTSNEFNRHSAVKARDGKMYFGGLNGINAFYPSVLDSLEKLEASRLVWTSFSKLDGKADSFIVNTSPLNETTKPLKLNHRDKTFTFHYALLSFTEPSENNYYYYLEGLEDNWNFAGNVSYTTYHSIPPGSYTLHVRATDYRGNPSLNQLTIPIVMPKPWRRTGWAYLLFVFCLMTLLYCIRYYELRRHRARSETRRLQELNSIKSRLYTNITHEFRTPLTIILGMADEINDPPESKNLIRRNSQRLLHLVNQMLGLAKVESGKLSLNMIQGDVVAFLQYLMESFDSYAQAKQISLHLRDETGNKMMDFDEEKLQSIISNLLSNAIKFSPNGSEIKLNVEEIQHGKDKKLLIKIKDSGIGIHSDKLKYVFDSFYQVDDSHTREGGGTGIGLTLTKELVLLLGGRIHVESKIAQGSTFTVTLPITHLAPLSENNTFEKVGSFMPRIEHVGNTSKKMNAGKDVHPQLLVIEDNRDVISYIQTCLRDKYAVTFAENGAVGIEMAIAMVPDIIISDIMMPLKDGFEVCATLKNDERTSHIPIILLTAKVDVVSRIEGLERGADAYLAKPFNKQELLVRLEQLVLLRKRLHERYAIGAMAVASEDVSIQMENTFLQKIRKLVEEHLDESNFGISELCQALLLSRMQVHRKLKALTNRSTSHIIRSIRLQNAHRLLRTTDLNISEIAYDTGFTDPNHFSRVFKEEYGSSPSEMRQ